MNLPFKGLISFRFSHVNSSYSSINNLIHFPRWKNTKYIKHSLSCDNELRFLRE